MRTIAVIGGGPAGATVARLLALRQYRVVLLDASSGPEHKVGECLPPNIRPLLEKLQLQHLLDKHHLSSYGHCSVWGSNAHKEEDFITTPYGNGVHIDRQAFEHSLAVEAMQAGVEWHYGYKVEEVEFQDNQWLIRSNAETEQEFFADFLIDASGRRAVSARYFGIKRVQSDNLVGVTAFVPMNSRNRRTLVESTPGGWWYSAVLPDDKGVVAFMTDADLVKPLNANHKEGWLAQLNQTVFTKKRLYCLTDNPLIEVKVKPASSSRLEHITARQWLCVGDSACTYDPVSSYGITAAIGAAYYAACAIHDSLEGRQDALLAYTCVMEQTYQHYLNAIAGSYAQERRWEDEPFWKRRYIAEYEIGGKILA